LPSLSKQAREGGENAGALGNHRVVGAFGGLHGLFPPRGAQTPFAAGLEPDAAEVVAARGGEVEEFAGYLGCCVAPVSDHECVWGED